MKYTLEYGYSFADNAEPKRHDQTINIKTSLSFEFPDQGKTDTRDFEARTGVAKKTFEDKFKSATQTAILEHYKSDVKTAAQALNSPGDWGKHLGIFVKGEVASVTKLFDETLRRMAKVAAKNQDDTISEKTLDGAEACALYLTNYPIKFTVADKFFTDHMIPAVDKNTVTAAAIERYKKNTNTKTTSWIELSKATVLNKATSGQKIAHVYSGAQQLGVYIKARQWTARITEITKKQDQKKNGVIQIKIQKDFVYLEIEFTKDENFQLFVMGNWVPTSGQAEIYHYEAHPPQKSNMVAKYLKWRHNESTKKYISPVAST
jgi:hypothetical protein